MKLQMKYLIAMMVFTVSLVLAVNSFAQTNTDSSIACRDVDGQENFVVRIGVPENVVSSGGVFCRVIHDGTEFVLTPATIGTLQVLSRGVKAATEVFGLDGVTPVKNFNREVQICLRGTGTFVFVNTAVSPRIIADMPAVTRSLSTGTYTCSFISGSGYAVLVQGPAAPPAELIEAQQQAEAAVNVSPEVAAQVSGFETLSGCRVTTTATVRLREEPTTSSAVVSRLPYDTNYQATARVDGWIQVIYLDGQGWVSDRYVNESAGCFE